MILALKLNITYLFDKDYLVFRVLSRANYFLKMGAHPKLKKPKWRHRDIKISKIAK